MSKAKKRLTKFDFTQPTAHVALVHETQGGAANEYKTLITKAADVKLELSMKEFLERFFYIWEGDANFLANLLGYSKDMSEYSGMELEEEMVEEKADLMEHDLYGKVELLKSAKEDFKALDDTAKSDVAAIVKKLSEFSNVTITDITKYAKGDSPLGDMSNDNNENPEEVNMETVMKAAEVEAMIAKALADEKAKWESDKAEEVAKAATQISELEKSLNAYKEAEEKAKKESFVAKAKEFEVLGVEGDAVEVVAKALMDASENENTKALVDLVEKAVGIVKGMEDTSPVGSDMSPEENMAEESATAALLKAKYNK